MLIPFQYFILQQLKIHINLDYNGFLYGILSIILVIPPPTPKLFMTDVNANSLFYFFFP